MRKIVDKDKELISKALEVAEHDFIFGLDKELERFIEPLFSESLDTVYRFCIFKDRKHPENELAYATAYVVAVLIEELADHNKKAGLRYIISTCRSKCHKMESLVLNRLDENICRAEDHCDRNRSVYTAVKELDWYKDLACLDNSRKAVIRYEKKENC